MISWYVKNALATKILINTTIYFLSIITYKERMDECDPCSAGFLFCMHILEINLWPSTPGSCDGGYKHNKSHSMLRVVFL